MRFNRRFVGVFVIVVTAILIAFDIYLAVDVIDGNTYSERLSEWAGEYFWIGWILAVALGGLVWHWFRNTVFPKYSDDDPPGQKLVLAGFFVLWFLLGIGMFIVEYTGWY